MFKNKVFWLIMIGIVLVIAACSGNEEATENSESNGENEEELAYNPPSMDDLDPDDPMTEAMNMVKKYSMKQTQFYLIMLGIKCLVQAAMLTVVWLKIHQWLALQLNFHNIDHVKIKCLQLKTGLMGVWFVV